MEMRGSDRNAEIISSIFLPGIHVQNMMERMSSTSYRTNRAETIEYDGTARGVVLARTSAQNTMGHGESQIGYLANEVNLHRVP